MVAAIEGYHDHTHTGIFPIVPENAGRVLDVGGGVGATSAALKQAGRATYVAVADQVADHLAPGIDRGFSGDLDDDAFVDRLGSEAGPFDTILLLDVLEHLRDPWSIVAKLHRVLAPGGVMVASIPNMNHFSLVGPLFFQGRFDLKDAGIKDRTHLRWFVKDTAIALMTSSGLTLEHVSPTIYGAKAITFNRVTFGLLTRFAALQYIIRVRRSAGV